MFVPFTKILKSLKFVQSVHLGGFNWSGSTPVAMQSIVKIDYVGGNAMIYLYSGTPGSGKSYDAAEMICKKYKQGKNIFCNFEINEDYLRKRYPKSKAHIFCIENRDLKYPFGLTGFSNNFHYRDSLGRVPEKQSYLFIDECNNNFDSRTWNEKGRTEWNHWFSEHRKDGFQVILITQSVDDIDKKIRKRIEIEVQHFNISNFKVFGKILALLFGGNLFVRRSQWFTKGKSKANKISSSFVIGRKKYFQVFNTSRRFNKALDDNPVWRVLG